LPADGLDRRLRPREPENEEKVAQVRLGFLPTYSAIKVSDAAIHVRREQATSRGSAQEKVALIAAVALSLTTTDRFGMPRTKSSSSVAFLITIEAGYALRRLLRIDRCYRNELLQPLPNRISQKADSRTVIAVVRADRRFRR
jgi:hypothetical protein